MNESPYETFLRSKRIVAQTVGIEVPLTALHKMLFPFQQCLVQWALRKGRSALFADTGLGKSFGNPRERSQRSNEVNAAKPEPNA